MSDNNLFSLDGKVALVTGSSTGLGKVMAKALGRAGAKVAMNYFNNEEIEYLMLKRCLILSNGGHRFMTNSKTLTLI